MQERMTKDTMGESREVTQNNYKEIQENMNDILEQVGNIQRCVLVEQGNINRLENYLKAIKDKTLVTKKMIEETNGEGIPKDGAYLNLTPQQFFIEFSKKYDENLPKVPFVGSIILECICPMIYFAAAFFLPFTIKLFSTCLGEINTVIGQMILLLLISFGGYKWGINKKKNPPLAFFALAIVLIIFQIFFWRFKLVFLGSIVNLFFAPILVLASLEEYFKEFSEEEKVRANNSIHQVFENKRILLNEHRVDTLISLSNEDNDPLQSSVKSSLFFLGIPVLMYITEQYVSQHIDDVLIGVKNYLNILLKENLDLKSAEILLFLFYILIIFVLFRIYSQSVNRKRKLYLDVLEDIKLTEVMIK